MFSFRPFRYSFCIQTKLCMSVLRNTSNMWLMHCITKIKYVLMCAVQCPCITLKSNSDAINHVDIFIKTIECGCMCGNLCVSLRLCVCICVCISFYLSDLSIQGNNCFVLENTLISDIRPNHMFPLCHRPLSGHSSVFLFAKH